VPARARSWIWLQPASGSATGKVHFRWLERTVG
jgi:hypothetical protein